MINTFIIALFFLLSLQGCGSSSSKTKLDLANYLPTVSSQKQYTEVDKVNGSLNNHEEAEDVIVESNLITIKKDNQIDTLITIANDEVLFKLFKDFNKTKKILRHFSKGDEISNSLIKDNTKILMIGSQRIGEENIQVEENCVLDDVVDSYKIFFYEYKNYDDEHDILKIKCTKKSVTETKIDSEFENLVSYQTGTVKSKEDISYFYLQKGLGVIASINDDCLVSKLPDEIDDNLDASECLGERYYYKLYHPLY